MSIADQRDAARQFRQLHRGNILVLPCAWNAASARLFATAGFPAVGTTSSGIAHSQGLPDGQQIRATEVIEVIERITDAVSIPVSADFEAGYGATHDEILDNIEAVVEAGAIGINIEDGTGPRADPLVEPNEQAELIEAINDLAAKKDVPLVINARTDVYLHDDSSSEQFEGAVERANRYLDAGADCAFVIGVSDRAQIQRLVDAIDGPINILANSPETPPVEDLDQLGVARVSVGGGPMHAAMGLVERIAAELRDDGTFSYLENTISHSEMQQRFTE